MITELSSLRRPAFDPTSSKKSLLLFTGLYSASRTVSSCVFVASIRFWSRNPLTFGSATAARMRMTASATTISTSVKACLSRVMRAGTKNSPRASRARGEPGCASLSTGRREIVRVDTGIRIQGRGGARAPEPACVPANDRRHFQGAVDQLIDGVERCAAQALEPHRDELGVRGVWGCDGIPTIGDACVEQPEPVDDRGAESRRDGRIV